MDINYEYYKIFYNVAKYGGFTVAAEKTYSNQPNLTRTIKKLERELGVALFYKAGRNVRLTPEGEELYAHQSRRGTDRKRRTGNFGIFRAGRRVYLGERQRSGFAQGAAARPRRV